MNKNVSKVKAFITFVFLLGNLESQAQIAWPVVTPQAKPWARWWWEGSAVNKQDLRWNMESYSAAGLGGLEITPIYGVKGHEQEFIPYLTPKWMEMLDYTLLEGKRLNLGIDMANATGWPFGGPWVTDADASKNLSWKTYEVKGGQQLNGLITFTQQALVRSSDKTPAAGSVISPIAKNENLQLLALDQVRFEKQLPLKVLMAYSEDGQILDLSGQVNNSGKLNWVAPAGSNWTLYALFEGDHGKMVERAAPGGEGLVIDHFSSSALKNYLGRFDQAFQGHNISGIRAFFNDSYEVDDAQGQADFSPVLFDEFLKRRGYDLRRNLPALFGKADQETSNRVLCDYRETIADLLLDNFTRPWVTWGSTKGALVRNQSHGSPANILDLYAAVGIPETEGEDVFRFKFAASAAHVSGKQLVASESATWLNDHFLSPLGNVKTMIDQFFLGGVNHVFYHGVSYSPKDAPWPGWLFYAAVHFNQTNPFWPHFNALNSYITRCQSFLQEGKPSNDVLIYYPLFDSFSERGKTLLKHYDALKPDFSGTGFENISKEMLKKGYSFDFISDKQILGVQSAGNQLTTGGSIYQTIVLPDCKYIPLSTMNRLVLLAKNGATIVVYKNLPSDVQGFSNLDERRKAYQAIVASLKFVQSEGGAKIATVGKGKFIVASDPEVMLQAAGVGRETMSDLGLQFIRRKQKNGYSYFIANTKKDLFQGWVPVMPNGKSVVIFNPMTKQSGLAQIKVQPRGGTQFYLQLQPGESCIVQTSDQIIKGAHYFYYNDFAKPVQIGKEWNIHFIEGGPTLPADIKTNHLLSWTDLGDVSTKSFSGLASYTTTFNKPADQAAFWRLHIEKVYESAEVWLNGNKLGILIGPDFSIDLPAKLIKPTNHLEIKVANLMANRIIYMDKNKIPYRIFYNTNFPAYKRENRGDDGLFTTVNWEPEPSGIVGQVTLKPLSPVIAL